MSDSASRDEKGSFMEPKQEVEMEKKDTVISEAVVAAAEYPSTQKRIVIMTALYLAVFLVTLVSVPPFSVIG
jgi:hypothetical protein